MVVVGTACVLVAFNLPRDLRLVYRIHHPRCIELQGRQDVVQAAEFLRDHCAKEGRFVSARYNNILTYLSGVSYLPVDRDLCRQRPPADAVLGYLDQERVDYVVTWTQPSSVSPFHERVRESIRNDGRYQLAFSHGDVDIFVRIPPGSSAIDRSLNQVDHPFENELSLDTVRRL